jgi:hypothetical protein
MALFLKSTTYTIESSDDITRARGRWNIATEPIPLANPNIPVGDPAIVVTAKVDMFSLRRRPPCASVMMANESSEDSTMPLG